MQRQYNNSNNTNNNNEEDIIRERLRESAENLEQLRKLREERERWHRIKREQFFQTYEIAEPVTPVIIGIEEEVRRRTRDTSESLVRVEEVTDTESLNSDFENINEKEEEVNGVEDALVEREGRVTLDDETQQKFEEEFKQESEAREREFRRQQDLQDEEFLRFRNNDNSLQNQIRDNLEAATRQNEEVVEQLQNFDLQTPVIEGFRTEATAIERRVNFWVNMYNNLQSIYDWIMHRPFLSAVILGGMAGSTFVIYRILRRNDIQQIRNTMANSTNPQQRTLTRALLDAFWDWLKRKGS